MKSVLATVRTSGEWIRISLLVAELLDWKRYVFPDWTRELLGLEVESLHAGDGKLLDESERLPAL